MITGIVFGEDIIVGPLLILSLINLIKLKASVVVHGRDCVEIMMHDRHDSHWFTI